MVREIMLDPCKCHMFSALHTGVIYHRSKIGKSMAATGLPSPSWWEASGHPGLTAALWKMDMGEGGFEESDFTIVIWDIHH